jgi:ferredoxin--NADP+ reductase
MAEVDISLNAEMTARRGIAPGLAVFRVRPDGWEVGEFLPGQFAVLGLPGRAPRCPEADPEEPPSPPDKLIRRAYSIASSSMKRQYLEFYIALVESGVLTPRLFALRPGDRLWLGRKFTGMFTLDRVAEDRNLVLIATGTGLAPYISMLRSRLLHARRGKVAVLHGARHSWDLGYRAELALIEREHGGFVYIPGITRPDEEETPWSGETGRIQDIWSRDPIRERWGFSPSREHTHIFLCGHPAMIEVMLEQLGQQGFRQDTLRTPGEIHLERYW